MTEVTPLDRVTVLCPAGARLDDPTAMAAAVPFDGETKAMIGAFSRRLAQETRARAWPEIVALAHWLRPRAIEDLEAGFRASLPAGTLALGRGVALHFAPGNVDTIFLYSALLSVLAGNATLVRVSSRISPQIDLLAEVLNAILAEPRFVGVAARIRILRYGRDVKITAALSESCDLRVIWGGDQSVGDIRAFPLPPRGRDVCFPDRWSLSVLDSEAVLVAGDRLPEIVRAFANDSYWFGQMACSSPRLVLWHGSAVAARQAAELFWLELERQAQGFAGDVQPVQFMDKLVAQCSAVIDGAAQYIRPTGSNMVSVSGMTGLSLPESALLHIGGGLFWEAHLPALDALAPLLDRRSQTIGSFGIPAADWADWTLRHSALVDRIVPLGQALQFDTIWDGSDLVREFTRLVAIRC